jgi:hypothetical protein
VELIISIIAYGIKGFFKGSWLNSFDTIIVLSGLIDTIISTQLLN